MPGNTSESPLVASLGESLRRGGMDSQRVQGIKDMADLLHKKYGIDFRDPKSVQAGLARLDSLHKLLQKDTSGTAAEDVTGDTNATNNITNILQGIMPQGSIFDR